MEYRAGRKPQITKELVEYLDKLYPNEVAHPKDSLQEVYFKAGRADAARHIRELYEKQEERVTDVQHT